MYYIHMHAGKDKTKFIVGVTNIAHFKFLMIEGIDILWEVQVEIYLYNLYIWVSFRQNEPSLYIIKVIKMTHV